MVAAQLNFIDSGGVSFDIDRDNARQPRCRTDNSRVGHCQHG